MERIEYSTLDKSDWSDGPWQHEPGSLSLRSPFGDEVYRDVAFVTNECARLATQAAQVAARKAA